MLDDADKDCPPLICPTRIACTATITEPVTSDAGDAVRLVSATVAKVSPGSFQPAEIDRDCVKTRCRSVFGSTITPPDLK